MFISYEIENNADAPTSISLETTISPNNSQTTNTNIYEKISYLRPSTFQRGKYELSFNFQVEDIKEPLLFIGNLKIKSRRRTKILQYRNQFEFDKKQLKDTNKGYGITTTFYSIELSSSLDVIITAKCKANFYPEYICDKFCLKTGATKFCDKNGIKVCEKGYYLNSKDNKCDHDWCFQSTSKCLHGGLCINMPNKFDCQCTLSYKGIFCEEFIDLCLNFLCPNSTTCKVKKERIDCEPIEMKKIVTPKKKETLNASIVSITIIIVAIISTMIGLCVTIWACRKPKKPKYIYSMDSGSVKTPSYYNYPNNENLSLSLTPPVNVQCACKFTENQPEWTHGQVDNYYSLRLATHQNDNNFNRRNSEMVMYRTIGRQNQRASFLSTNSNHGDDCDNLPLPPPIESEVFMNNALFL